MTTLQQAQQPVPMNAGAPAVTAAVTQPQAVNNITSPSYPIASLYVGDLHFDVTEAMLYEKFSQCGPVLSIRVCRDLVTRRSLGYAYVNFQQPNDAERALDTMNFDDLKQRPMRIMWSQRDPSVRKSGLGNIFIKNLDKTIDNKQLYDTFSQFGNILSCKIVKDEKGGSQGYGFVHFESDDSASQAINDVNGMLLQDRKVFVGRFRTRDDRQKETAKRQAAFTNVFVKNLPEDCTEEELIELCSKHVGTEKALSVKLMTDESGKSKCFGFASFANHDDADLLVKGLHETTLREKQIYAGRAQKKTERVAQLKAEYTQRRDQDRKSKFLGVNLYVKNLDDTVTDEMLQQAFSPYGGITSAKVMCDEKNVSKGFGFVCFTSPEEATKALTEMNGRIVGTKPLYVALAQRKEERKQHLAQQYMQRGAGFASGQNTMQAGFNPNLNYGQVAVPHYQMASYPMMGQPRMMGHPGMRLQGQPGGLGAPRAAVPFGQIPGLRGNAPRAMGVPRNMYAQPMGGVRPMMAPAGVRQTFGNVNANSPYKFNQQVRNAPQSYGVNDLTNQFQATNITNANVNVQQQQQVVPNQQQPQPQQQQQQPPQELNAAMLAAAEPSQQKQMLGERIYPLVNDQIGSEQAGKVTGMLLEIENFELLKLIDEPALLKDKVTEAMKVLQDHSDK